MLSRLLTVGSLCLAIGCAPTISLPRGKEHLDALAQAESDQHAGRLKEAAAAYGRAAETAERRVDRDESLYRQSRVYARMGDLKSAIAVLDGLASADPPARRTLRARLDASNYRLALGQETDRADADLRAIIINYPDDAAAKGAFRELVQIHVKDVESVDQALNWLRNLESETAEDNTTHEAMLNLEADLLLAKGSRQEAVEVLERMIEQYPYPHGRHWDDGLWQLSEIALQDKDPEHAIEYLEKMIAVHERSIIIGSYTRPMFSKAALKIARIYRDELQNPKEALKAYEHVRSEFPTSTVVDDAMEEEAVLRIETGDTKKGCALLREVTEKHDVGSARKRAQEQISRNCS